MAKEHNAPECRASWIESFLRRLWRVLTERPNNELSELQAAIVRGVRQAAPRSRMGLVCYPTGAYVRLHPDDLPLWTNFHQIIKRELHQELSAIARDDPQISYDGCRIFPTTDDSVPRGRPDVTVDWGTLTVMHSALDPAGPALSPDDERGAATERWSGTPFSARSAGSAPHGLPPRGWLKSGDPRGLAVPLPIPGAAPLVVGRGAACGASVPASDRRASKRHAQIRYEGLGMWTVTDLGSVNGTYVDGRRIEETTPLHHGSVLTIGATTFQVEIREAGSDRVRQRRRA